MTLKSSKIKNFLSWRISTILKSFIVASASCHLPLPHIIKPILRVLESVLKIKSFSLQNSILIEVILCRRRVCSFCHWVSLIKLSTWFNINRFLSKIGTVLKDEQVVEGLLGFAFALDRLANANTSVFISEVSCSLSSYSLLLKSVTNFFKPWENSDPRVRIVLVHRFNSDFHSMFTL